MPTTAAASECGIDRGRPKIGLVLGGGGARGAAHIGVIRRLEELRIPVDVVTGTSIGSLVGAFYATGMDADELERTIKSIDFDELFKDATDRQDVSYRRKQDDNLALFGPKFGVGKNSQLLPRGAVHGQKISYLFETLTASRARPRTFDDLPIPYRAVAADIVTGKAVVLGDGPLSVAMRASMSVPGVFDPVERGEHLLVDGGIADNVPIDVARSMGADVIIAVDVGTPLSTREDLKTLVNFTSQLSSLLITRNAEAQIATLGSKDLLIRPELGDEITSASFSKISKGIPIGYAAAVAADADLARYSVSVDEYADWRNHIEGCVQGAPLIQFVEIDNRSRFSDDVIAKAFHVDLGKPLNQTHLDEAIADVYGLGFIDLARYEVIERDGQSGIRLLVEQDARGTTFAEWGLDIINKEDDTTANLRVALLKTDLDDYGSELRLLTQLGDSPAIMGELYKYLEPRQHWVLYPKMGIEWRDLRRYDERGNPEQIVDITQATGQLLLVREFGRASAVQGGVRLYDGDVRTQLGELPHENDEYRGGEYVLGYNYDALDDRYFPSHGGRITLNYVRSDGSLGADQAFDQIESQILGATTLGRSTFIGLLNYDTTLDESAPVYAAYRAGGLFRLSGLEEDEISGSHFGFALASWRYRVGTGAGFFPAYAGISLEYGNATDRRDDIWDEGIGAGSLYFGYHSPIGPLYWGMGLAEGGEQTYFLRIGNVFGRTSIGR